jgi:UDPglucose 6-dehydrogenase
MEKAKEELPGITYCVSHYEAAQNADAILLLTEWNEFRNLDWKGLAKSVAHPLLIDGRNLYSPEEVSAHGFQYVCIGKEPGSAHAAPMASADLGLPAVSTIAPLPPEATSVQPRL